MIEPTYTHTHTLLNKPQFQVSSFQFQKRMIAEAPGIG